MITKSIFKIHSLFYIVAFICFLTGYFKNFVIFSSIILFHEMGHILIGCLFKWKIERVVILPFGGITLFNEKIDKPLLEEFLIAIAGPLFQIVYLFMYKNNIDFFNYNITILIFNLLPMYPLDGSRILNIIFNKVFSFKFSHILSIFVSFIICLLFIIFNMNKFNLLLCFIIFFIMLEIFRETSKHNHYFNKFLLEKYLYNKKYKNRKIINKIDKMKKQTTHIFKIQNNCYTEREIIRNLFDK